MKITLPNSLEMFTVSRVSRVLALMMIWGVGAFLWGSLGAWAHHKAIDDNRALVRRQLGDATKWLQEMMEPVQKLAQDDRLEAAVALPTGVESAPVQRVLYEFSYLHSAQDIYVVDLSNDTVGQIAGASALRTEVLARIKQMKGAGLALVGAGERNGVVYVASRVAAPLPHQVFVLVPYTLGKMAATRPEVEESDEMEMGLMLPHTAGWAWWPMTELRFVLRKEEMPIGVGGGVLKDGDGATVLLPAGGVENVWLGVKRAKLVVGKALLPQGILLAWMLGMTLAVFWQPTAGVRARMMGGNSVVSKGLRSFGRGVALPLAFAGSWVNARMRKDLDPPLIDGPGDFLPGDFKNPKGLAGPGKKIRNPADVGDSLRRHEAKVPDLQDMQRQQEEREMKEIIKRCLREGRLSLLYQPIFDATTNMPVMHEVYARLIRPDGEMMTPAQFLPTANKFGLTQALDAAVFKKVLGTHFDGPNEPATKMALNVGGTSLDGIAYLQELLNNGQHIMKSLVFEVRSQEIVRDPKALKLLKDLQRHGGQLAVDYFGGGNAMLEASRVMGFDYVKLDGMRFAAMPESKQEMLELCATAKKVGLPVVVEKIEGPEMEQFCRDNGVLFLQGYGLSRPSESLTISPLERGAPATGAAPAAAPTAAKADKPAQ